MLTGLRILTFIQTHARKCETALQFNAQYLQKTVPVKRDAIAKSEPQPERTIASSRYITGYRRQRDASQTVVNV